MMDSGRHQWRLYKEKAPSSQATGCPRGVSPAQLDPALRVPTDRPGAPPPASLRPHCAGLRLRRFPAGSAAQAGSRRRAAASGGAGARRAAALVGGAEGGPDLLFYLERHHPEHQVVKVKVHRFCEARVSCPQPHVRVSE